MDALLRPEQVITHLQSLRALTSDALGAQRVAFTPVWRRARAWYRQLLQSLPVSVKVDPAGNLWATLPGSSPRVLILGGHLDSVPNGGWLDGALNVLAGYEVLRFLAQKYPEGPPCTICLVDWADEEGARFGKSLFGSSFYAGRLRTQEIAELRDAEGSRLLDVLRENGMDPLHLEDAASDRSSVAAYLELHIEQGPVLLDQKLPLAVVAGTYGVERHRLTFHGQAAHSGSTPMARRRDALLAASRLVTEIPRLCQTYGGVGTAGSCVTLPGIPTSVVAQCQLTLDFRHLDPPSLAALWKEASALAQTFATQGGVSWDSVALCQQPPAPFHPALIERAQAVVRRRCGTAPLLPSGPLHDATSLALAGIPTAMLFVQSLLGISHNALEDTHEEHLHLAVAALADLAEETIDWIQSGQTTVSNSAPSLPGTSS